MPVLGKQTHLLLLSVGSGWRAAALAQQKDFLPRKKSLQDQNDREAASLPRGIAKKAIVAHQEQQGWYTFSVPSESFWTGSSSEQKTAEQTARYQHYQPQPQDYMSLNTQPSRSVCHLPRSQRFPFRGSPEDWKYLDSLRPEKISSSFSSSVTTASSNHGTADPNLTI